MPRLFPWMLVTVLTLGAAGRVAGQDSVVLERAGHPMLPLTIYAPKPSPCRGVAIISPGAGGSERGYQYLGETMSALGYLSVVIGHQESGSRALREQMRGDGLRGGLTRLKSQPEAHLARSQDVAASGQWAQSRCESQHSVLLGHSMGASTVMIEAGARNKVGVQGAQSFDVYIALSPQGVNEVFPENAWSDIQQPVLMLTGTRDDELGGAPWTARTTPFHNMPSGCKWLGVIDGATHMNFSGRGASRRVESLSAQAIIAFLAGIQRGDCRPSEPLPGLALDTK